MFKINLLLILAIIHILAYVPSATADWYQDNLYPRPHPSPAHPADQQMVCAELDAAIDETISHSYSQKPDPYQDPMHGLAVWGSFYWPPTIGYLAYSGVAEYSERARVSDKMARITWLRHLKAKRRCYETD